MTWIVSCNRVGLLLCTYLRRFPSTNITPSKCKLTDCKGRASPGPGRKFLCDPDVAGVWYVERYGLCSTVTRTRYDLVVYRNTF